MGVGKKSANRESEWAVEILCADFVPWRWGKTIGRVDRGLRGLHGLKPPLQSEGVKSVQSMVPVASGDLRDAADGIIEITGADH
jgi:hypothetical protein